MIKKGCMMNGVDAYIQDLEERLELKKGHYKDLMSRFKRDAEIYSAEMMFEKNESGVLSEMATLKGEINGLITALELAKVFLIEKGGVN